MSTPYKPVASTFQEELKALAEQKIHTRIQYYSDINEFLTIKAGIKAIVQKADADYLELTTGDEIRLDRIVRIGSKPAPGYDEEYFKCDI